MHTLLQSGEFGDCSDYLMSYSRSCFALFLLATTFKPADPPDKPREGPKNEPIASNSIDEDLSAATEQRLGIE